MVPCLEIIEIKEDNLVRKFTKVYIESGQSSKLGSLHISQEFIKLTSEKWSNGLNWNGFIQLTFLILMVGGSSLLQCGFKIVTIINHIITMSQEPYICLLLASIMWAKYNTNHSWQPPGNYQKPIQMGTFDNMITVSPIYCQSPSFTLVLTEGWVISWLKAGSSAG